MSKKKIECPICEEDILKQLTIKVPGIGRICPHHEEAKEHNEKISANKNRSKKRPEKPQKTQGVEPARTVQSDSVSTNTQTGPVEPTDDEIIDKMADDMFKQITTQARRSGHNVNKLLTIFKQRYLTSPEKLNESEKQMLHRVFTKIRHKIKTT